MDAFSRLTLDIVCAAGFGHTLGSARRAAACVGENHQQMEPLLPSPETTDAAGRKKRKEDLDEGDQISLAVRLGFEEVAKRLTDPLRVLKFLPGRYRRTVFARRVLRRVIEKAVAERAVRFCVVFAMGLLTLHYGLILMAHLFLFPSPTPPISGPPRHRRGRGRGRREQQHQQQQERRVREPAGPDDGGAWGGDLDHGRLGGAEHDLCVASCFWGVSVFWL